jgi:transcriptional regulator with XRE-family HTH domain
LVVKLSAALAAAIRERRNAARISQEKLADRAGLHRTYVSLVERAKRNVTVDALDHLAGGLDISASTLLADAERRRGPRPPLQAR